MIYTTHGIMTAADVAEIRRDMDLDLCGCCEAGPVTLEQLAKELGAQPHEVAGFGNFGPILDADTYAAPLPIDEAHAIREAWHSAPDA